ncbi:glycosyltransferase [Actinocrinis puniceicyclus]|uniref:Glycosyltransferase n=1 Tax=Actinocrinis puniceicyclus TaxID=977794 RepID=A0A8J7WR43_9ACTN|nr:glycosyltransferase family 2 protein [Actinocrinis puniceicyclus]MBS2964457.1 glycosyltransferase [Actinocrinis puniceicyclus]
MSQYAPPARPQPHGADPRGAEPRAAGSNPLEALRHHVVTAVLVSHDGGRWLGPVLDALLNQRRPVQRVIAVDTGSRDNSVDLLETALGADQVLHRKRSTGYGAAVAFGLKSSPPVAYDEFGYDSPLAPVEWIWLLHDDSAPAPDALGQLLLTAEDEPDAAVLGPKIRGWYDKKQLLEVGATVAANGRRWTGLEHNEHDQGQHDETRPVLCVSSAGMLVRREVWDRLRGFDRNISIFRDDLDFCWRVNSAGYKVVVAPDAVMHHAEAAARERRRIGAGPNRPRLLDRSHALYTVAVNKDSRFWPALCLRLMLGSFFRTLGFVIAKQPGTAYDELVALLTFAARPDRILRGRSTRRKLRVVGGEQIEQFFPPRGALARNALDNLWTQLRGEHADSAQESSRHRSVETGPVSEESEALETDSTALLLRLIRNPIIAVGGGLTLVALLAARSILVGGALAGGALLPTPPGSADLWSAYLAGWHGVGLGTTAYSPPYLAVLALLATLLLGKASWAVSVLLIGSVPLAGLSASYAFRRITSSAPLRIWAGYAYALLAVATGAIATGRLGTAVAVAVLPLVVTTASQAVGSPGRTGSTRSAWTCAFLLTVATAFAPVTWVLALVFGALATITVAWRTRSNIAVTVIRMGMVLGTPLVVLVPWSLSLLRHPTSFFLEPGLAGVNLERPAPTPLGLLLGNPGGPGTYPAWIGLGLLLAALAALLRGTRRRVVVSAWAMALVGFGSAVVIAGLKVTPPGSSQSVIPWPGVSTALLGLGLITATVVGAEGARERIASAAFGWRQPLTVLITTAAVLAPAAAGTWWLLRGAAGPIARISAELLPPYVAAEGQTAARPRTLMLTGGSSGAVGYGIVRDAGPTLGTADLRTSVTQNAKVDAVVGQLLSGNGGDAAQQLAAMDVGYIMVGPTAPASVSQALTGVAGLTERSTSQGGGKAYGLWSVNGDIGRVTVQDQAGNALPVSYQCSNIPPVPQGSAQVCAQDTGATLTVPPGPSGRRLVLAEDALTGWSAVIGDQKLTALAPVDGFQAWQLPAGGGTVSVGYHSVKHTVWLLIGGLAALAATIMALPFGRRPDEDIEGEQAAELDAATRPSASVELEPEPEPEPSAQQADHYRESGPYREPEPYPAAAVEPEFAPESGPEPAGVRAGQYGADEYASGEYQAAGYPADEYQSEAYRTGEYQQGDRTEEYHSGSYQAPGYGAGEYSAADPSYEQYPMGNADPYAQEQYQEQYTYQQQGSYGQPPYQNDYETGGYEQTAPAYGQHQQEQDEYDSGQHPQAQYGQQYAQEQYPAEHHVQEPYAAAQYGQAQYEQAQYEQAPYEQAPYENGAYGQYGEQYTDPAAYQYGAPEYGVPEQRQPDDQALHQPVQQPHGHEYDSDGYGHGEQDGWTR